MYAKRTSLSGCPNKSLAFISVLVLTMGYVRNSIRRMIGADCSRMSTTIFLSIPAHEATRAAARPTGPLATRAAAAIDWAALDMGALAALVALLFVNAYFSLVEIALTTLWPWKMRELAGEEAERGERGVFSATVSDVSRFLSTILIGSTLANVATSTLAAYLAGCMFGPKGVAISAAVLAVVVLVFCEIVPKTIAVTFATPLARLLLPAVNALSVPLYPLSRCLTAGSNVLLRLFGVDPDANPEVSEEELRLVVAGAGDAGSLSVGEQALVERAMDMDSRPVAECMTPLCDVVAVNGDAPLGALYELWRQHRFSRVPVYSKRVDNVIGIAFAADLLELVDTLQLESDAEVGGDGVARATAGPSATHAGEHGGGGSARASLADISLDSRVRDLMHEAVFVSETMSHMALLSELQQRRLHMACLVHESGGVVGIATLEDVLESLVGEIYDEKQGEANRAQRDLASVAVDARDAAGRPSAATVRDAWQTRVEDFSEILGVSPPDGDYDMVSGWAISVAFNGYIAQAGQRAVVELSWDAAEAMAAEDVDGHDEGQDVGESRSAKWLVTVVKADKRRVDTITVQRCDLNDCYPGDDEGAHSRDGSNGDHSGRGRANGGSSALLGPSVTVVAQPGGAGGASSLPHAQN